MERALKTVRSRLPDAIENLNNARDSLIKKFREKTIGNITDFRMLSKIATSVVSVNVKEIKASEALQKIFEPNNRIGIRELYEGQFASVYDDRKLLINIDAISDFIKISIENDEVSDIDSKLREKLKSLAKLIEKMLRA
jgi:hypothetical protein